MLIRILVLVDKKVWKVRMLLYNWSSCVIHLAPYHTDVLVDVSKSCCLESICLPVSKIWLYHFWKYLLCCIKMITISEDQTNLNLSVKINCSLPGKQPLKLYIIIKIRTAIKTGIMINDCFQSHWTSNRNSHYMFMHFLSYN